MIARQWHGWTTSENANAYESHVRTEIFPPIQRVNGYRGAYLLRRRAGDEVEFMALTLFDSLDAVRAFAGENYQMAVISPIARNLLSHFDEQAVHYDVAIELRSVPN